MRNSTVFRDLLGVENTVVEGICAVGSEVVISVRPLAAQRRRCGVCERKSRPFDSGGGRRRWRTMDLGIKKCYLEAGAPRVRCRDHGVTVAHVPWARHNAGHTRPFDDLVVWLGVHSAKTTVSQLLRVTWRTVGAIMERVWNDFDAATDRLAGLTRIGIDEFSYRKGHKYVTLVVDHDSHQVVWMSEGRDSATVRRFFDDLGAERCAQLTHVSADGADFIDTVVAERAPNAVRCADPFHVVKWATAALDDVRRQVWNEFRVLARQEVARPRGRQPANAPARPFTDAAKGLKGARYSLWKNPENLSDCQRQKLDWITKTSPTLHRAYLLKEGLRLVFQMELPDARVALDKWLSWARRCQIPAFIKLAKSITKHRDRILASIEHNLSNAIVESTNTKSRVLARMAYGFHSAQALIAIIMLNLGGLDPQLPGRT